MLFCLKYLQLWNKEDRAKELLVDCKQEILASRNNKLDMYSRQDLREESIEVRIANVWLNLL